MKIRGVARFWLGELANTICKPALNAC